MAESAPHCSLLQGGPRPAWSHSRERPCSDDHLAQQVKASMLDNLCKQTLTQP